MELRWAVEPGTTTEAPVLQFRVRMVEYRPDGRPDLTWSDWEDVPTVVAPRKPITGPMDGWHRILGKEKP